MHVAIVARITSNDLESVVGRLIRIAPGLAEPMACRPTLMASNTLATCRPRHSLPQPFPDVPENGERSQRVHGHETWPGSVWLSLVPDRARDAQRCKASSHHTWRRRKKTKDRTGPSPRNWNPTENGLSIFTLMLRPEGPFCESNQPWTPLSPYLSESCSL